MSGKFVSDGLIERVNLYKSHHWLFRWDVFPFAFSYSILFAAALSSNESIRLIALIAIPFVLAAHLVLFLLSQWSIKLKCKLGNKEVSDISEAEYVHVKAALNAGNDRIVKLRREAAQGEVRIAGTSHRLPREFFVFQKLTYSYDPDRNTFQRLEYPTTSSLMNILRSTGHKSQQDFVTSIRKWGLNEFDIPIPSFLDLYMEHLVAPFFVFQVLCLVLWSLDDYWYYSAFTLLMLMFFEGMLCKQRQSSLLMLRNMRRPPVEIFVLRGGRWEERSSEEIVPGDVISLKAELKRPARRRIRPGIEMDDGEDAPPAVSVVPCDALLLRGGCVANEAMLTGESVPQMKESLVTADADPADPAEGGLVDLGPESSVDPAWRRHMVFGGTSLLQHSDGTQDDEDAAASADSEKADNGGASGKGSGKGKGDDRNLFAVKARRVLSQLPAAPDGGCVALVVRTGFGTSQGGLMRKILFATERVNANSSETFYFIGVLVVFAVVASAAVLHGGLQDPNRNRFRLALHCIMIVTSVVPPELPMELSLAVTNSLAALSRGLVFCTEPFRIALAGKLDVLCFDKTGTLTQDKMILRGIVGAPDATLSNSSPVDSPYSLVSKPTASKSGPTSKSAGVPAEDGDDVEVEVEEVPSLSVLTTVLDPSSASTPCPEVSLAIMGACHSLMIAEGGVLVGDPLELATIEATGFQFVHTDAVQTHGGGGHPSGAALGCVVHRERGIVMKLKHRYPFSSTLKRMSTIVEHCALPSAASVAAGRPVAGQTSLFLFTKGAPEVLAEPGFLATVPPFYHATYLHHMSRGKRVLALAYRRLPAGRTLQQLRDLPRAELESGLTFAGFLIFDCDLKADSKSVIRELKNSDHRVIMITGDSAYTAADVAKRLGMMKPDSTLLVLQTVRPRAAVKVGILAADVSDSSRTLVWRQSDGVQGISDSADLAKGDIPFDASASAIAALTKKHCLCVTGPALSFLRLSLDGIASSSTKMPAKSASGDDGKAPRDTATTHGAVCRFTTALRALSPNVTIFARVSPAQKETVVQSLNDSGLFTLMCGDGTNDVGALKASHVGVSIVNDPDFEKRIEAAKDPAATTSGTTSGTGKKPKGTLAKERMTRAMAELQAQDLDPTIVRLGDASIASPFTARRTSIDCVLTVLRQGRCTLVTTIQVFKVLALNCLVSAYMMSALYLRGLKQGDVQMTASGVVTAGLFFFLSQAKPMVQLSPQRPPSSVFRASVAASIAGQFTVHLLSLIATLALCERHMAADDHTMTADGKFQPNVVNSAVYLLSAVMQVNNFVVNYRGHPFTQSIQENTLLWRSVQGIYASLLIVAGGQLPPLNDFLQLAPFPSSNFQAILIAILVLNFGVSFAIEKACQRFLESEKFLECAMN